MPRSSRGTRRSHVCTRDFDVTTSRMMRMVTVCCTSLSLTQNVDIHLGTSASRPSELSVDDPRTHPRRERSRRIIGILIGSLFGFGVSTVVYVLVNPILERSSGLLRETQGILWSMVPVLTAVGAVVGYLIAKREADGH